MFKVASWFLCIQHPLLENSRNEHARVSGIPVIRAQVVIVTSTWSQDDYKVIQLRTRLWRRSELGSGLQTAGCRRLRERQAFMQIQNSWMWTDMIQLVSYSVPAEDRMDDAPRCGSSGGWCTCSVGGVVPARASYGLGAQKDAHVRRVILLAVPCILSTILSD